MKNILSVMIFLLLCIFLYAESISVNPLTEIQINKMVSAAGKERPHSIDITLYKEIIKPPMSEEEFRKMFENIFEKDYGPKEKLSGWELENFNRNVRLNLEEAVNTQKAGLKIKQRIRISGQSQRIDQVIGHPRMVVMKGTPDEETRQEVMLGPDTPYEMTSADVEDKNKGNYSFTYFHGDSKSAQITVNKKSGWAKSNIINFAVLGTYFQGIVGTNKCPTCESKSVPAPDKLKQLKETGSLSDGTRITINPAPDNPNEKERIEVRGNESSCGTIMVYAKEDYSHVYYIEVCNPSTGKPLYIRECSDFDSQGFPHNITETQYDLAGNFKEKLIYRVEKVRLNPVIPDEVFEFNPPEDYQITKIDEATGASTVIHEKGGDMWKLRVAQKTKDIKTLKELLKNKEWKIRLEALKSLEVFLKVSTGEDKETLEEALEEAVVILKDDDNPTVREEVEKVLQNLGTVEPSTLP